MLGSDYAPYLPTPNHPGNIFENLSQIILLLIRFFFINL
jgi:hypothetical protein